MTIDQREFRNALGSFATGITVVTLKTGEGAPLGVTINSFASVSLDPPLILFSLKKDSDLIPVFKEAAHFNINILHESQQDISNLFAGPGEDKFASLDWSEGENLSPLLAGTLNALECKNATQYDGGDHTIFIGEVTRVCGGIEGNPLLYFNGSYGKIA